MHMSGIRLIDELTCCRNHNTTTLQYRVEAEENWGKQALLQAVAYSIAVPERQAHGQDVGDVAEFLASDQSLFINLAFCTRSH
jgi:hypothetical protein